MTCSSTIRRLPRPSRCRAATVAMSSRASGSREVAWDTSSSRPPALYSDTLLEVGQALARGGRVATQTPLEELTGEAATAEPEREREREDEPAEGDAEGDQHHLLADAEMGESGGAREEQHAPVHGACKDAGLWQACVHGRDEQSLAQEVRDEPADEQHEHRCEERRDEGDQERGRTAEPERIDTEAGEDHERRPEEQESEHVGRRAQNGGAPHRAADTPALHVSIEADRAGEAAHDRA